MADPFKVTAIRTYGRFWIRLVARLVDFVILGIPAGLLLGTLGWIQYDLLGGDPDSPAHAVVAAFQLLGTALVLVGVVLYQLLLWTHGGATVGQRALGLRVVDATTGGPITLGTAGTRCIGQLLDTAVCGLPIGYVWAAFDHRKQTWHDKLAGTVVVRRGSGLLPEPVPDGTDRLNEWATTALGVVGAVLVCGLLVISTFICWPAFAVIVWLQPSGTRRQKLAATLIGLAIQVAFLGWQAVHQGCRLQGTDVACRTAG